MIVLCVILVILLIIAFILIRDLRQDNKRLYERRESTERALGWSRRTVYEAEGWVEYEKNFRYGWFKPKVEWIKVKVNGEDVRPGNDQDKTNE